MKSEPESSGVLEERHEGAIDVACHEGFDAAQELAADEDSGDGLLAVGVELVEDGLYVRSGGVLVELDDDGADAEAEEEALGHSAHATPAHAEHHNRVASRQLPHRLVWAVQLHRFCCVTVDGDPAVHSDSGFLRYLHA
jgi:hypothetical protein